MAKKLFDNTLVRARGDVVSCALGDGTALLDMSTSSYYSLNPVGAHIWEVIKTPATFGAIRDSILETFEVSSSACEADLVALLEHLAKAELIEMSNATAG